MNRLRDVDLIEAGLDRLKEQFHVQLAEKVLALLQVGAVAKTQRERLEPAKIAVQFAHHCVRCKKNRAAVDAAGEAAANRLRFRDALEPLAHFVFQRGDVVVADRVEVGWVVVAPRVEKALVCRVGIGAADELNRHQVMCRNHACVVRMKLVAKTLFFKPLANGVDAMSDDERRTLDLLGQEIAQWPVERAGQLDRLATLGNERERAVEVTDGFRRVGKHALARLVGGEVEQLGLIGISQVNDPFDVLMHVRIIYSTT